METVLRTFVTYWLLLVLVRLTGRRSLQAQTPFELVLLFVFGGAGLQGIVITDDHSLINTIVAVATIVVTHQFALVLERRWPNFARLAHGTPIILAENGDLRDDWLERTLVEREDIMAAARQQGIGRLDELQTIVLERNGAISVIPKSDHRDAPPAGDRESKQNADGRGSRAQEGVSSGSNASNSDRTGLDELL